MLILVVAQAAVAASPAQAVPTEGVIAYPPSFFTAQSPANAWEMLQRLPGFTLNTGGAIRGFEGGGGNALVDGQRPASKTDNIDEVLRRIPASQVERIDLIRGGAPGIDMQGRTVIANVIRRTGDSGLRGLVVVANVHLADGRNMLGTRGELSGSRGRIKWEASHRFADMHDDSGDNGPEVRIAPDGQVIRRSQIRGESDGPQHTLTGAVDAPLAGGDLRLNARLFWDKRKFEQDNVFQVATGFEPRTLDELTPRHDTEFAGRFGRALGSRAAMEVLALRQTRDQQNSSRFAAPGVDNRFALDRRSSETIGRAVLTYRVSSTLSAETGVEGAFNHLDSLTTVSENGVAKDLPAANVTVEEKRGEAFARGTWRPDPSLTLEAGLRFEASRISSDGDVALEKSLSFIKPRAAVTWQALPATQVRASVERVVGQLNFDDFVATSGFETGQGVSAGNPDLDPETAWVGEVGLEQRLWGGGVLVATLRHSELSDVIDRGPVVDAFGGIFDRPTNIGDGTKDELTASLSLPFGRIGLKGGLLKAESTWRRSKVIDPTTGEPRGISRLRPLEWSMNFSYDLPRWKLNWGLDVFSGWTETTWRYNAIDERKLHNSVVKLFAEWRPAPSWNLRFEFSNLATRGTRITRAQYGGRRGAAPLLYTDDRDLGFGRTLYVRVKKSFG